MDMLVAKTVINRMVKPGKAADPTKNLKRVPPETEEVQPGELFEPRDAAERAELINLGAAAPAPKGMDKDGARTAAGKAATKAAAKTKAAKADDAAAKDSAASKKAAEGGSGDTTVTPASKGVTATTGTTKHGGDGDGDDALV